MLKSMNTRQDSTADKDEPVQVTATLTINRETGKILDIGLVSGYLSDGTPKYGCIKVKEFFGPHQQRAIIHPYGYGPDFEEIQRLNSEPDDDCELILSSGLTPPPAP